MQHRKRSARPAQDDYEVVRYRPAHREQIIDMQRLLWSQDPEINREYFAWKYEKNPYLRDVPIIYVALSGGKVVGMRGIFGVRWHAGDPGRQFPFMQVADMLIHPEHRGRGLFRRIISASIDDLAEQGDHYLISLGAGPTTFVGSLRMGWRCPGSYALLRRETPRATLRRWVRRALRGQRPSRPSSLSGWATQLTAHDPFARLDQALGEADRRELVIDHAPRPEAMARLVDRIGFSRQLQHVRDAEYFAWRFRDPRSRFRFIFSGGPELNGYMVLRARVGRQHSVVDIADWEGTSTKVARDLLRAAIGFGRFEDLRIWGATLPEDKRAALRDQGFKAVDLGFKDRQGRPVPNYPGLVLHPSCRQPADADFTVAGRRLDDIDSWDLRMLYSD